MENHETNFFGLTSFRNQRKKFGIKRDDRRRHFYTIGKTGMGKSNLMENMAIQDIQNGHGVAYIDPHGEGAEKLLDFVPSNRINDVVYFNPADLDFPIAFNVMEKVEFKYRHLVAGGLMGVFKKVWPDVWSARMEYILSNAILALLEYPDSTLLGINRMLADVDYRAQVVAKVQDPIVKSFWVTEYSRYTQRYEIEATAAIQNKVGQFVSNALIRNIVGQTKSTINMRNIMDEQKILIIDLSKGRIGEDNSRLLGALIITKIQLAAMSRVDIPENDRKDFYMYVDEFQNFATESFANILSEARKYRLCLTVGHQYISQMDEIVRDAVFGNVGTLAVFRVGAEDAEFLEKEFSPEFTADDLVNLTKYNIYLKLMIDGIASHPFSAETMPPPTPLVESNRDKIIQASRERYGVAQAIVEDKISRWTGLDELNAGAAPKKPGPIGPMPRTGPNRPAAQARAAAPASTAIKALDNPTTLYDAICSLCGKNTKVIFEPSADRPIYCKSCLKKMKRAEEEKKQSAPAPASVPVAEKKEQEPVKLENVSFKSRNKDGKPTDAPKRKEVNLSELKALLDESLSKEEKEDDLTPDEKEEIAEEDLEVKREPGIPKEPKKDEPQHPDHKKGVITPGQKVTF